MDLLTFFVLETAVIAIPPVVWLLDRRHKRDYEYRRTTGMTIALAEARAQAVSTLVEKSFYRSSDAEKGRMDELVRQCLNAFDAKEAHK